MDKKKARLSCIAHLLSLMPYAEVPREAIELPAPARNSDHIRQPALDAMMVPGRH